MSDETPEQEGEASFVLGDGPITFAPSPGGMAQLDHVHGPGCGHDHGEGHVHGPGCGHDHDHDHAHHHEERPHDTRAHGDHEHACQLDLEFLLPGEGDEIGRFAELEKRISEQNGIVEVHRRTDGPYPELCIHYDPVHITVAKVLELARST